MQVTSLRSQANEHRVIKEKLQAAVAAALSAEADTISPCSSDLLGTAALPADAPGSGIALDLQDAVSSLKVGPVLLLAVLTLGTASAYCGVAGSIYACLADFSLNFGDRMCRDSDGWCATHEQLVSTLMALWIPSQIASSAWRG